MYKEQLLNKLLETYVPTQREEAASRVWNAATYAYHKLIADALDDPLLKQTHQQMINDFGFHLNQAIRGHLNSGTYPYFYMIIPGGHEQQFDLRGVIARSLIDPNAPKVWDAYETMPRTVTERFWQAATIPGLSVCTMTYKIPQPYPSRTICGVNTIPSRVRPGLTR